MSNMFNTKSRYTNVLNRIKKKFSTYEGILIMKKQYFTENMFYYFLCILFRFIHLISFSGDYSAFFDIPKNVKTFQKFSKNFTIYSIISQMSISFKIYSYLVFIIFILVLIRLLIYYFIISGIHNYDLTNKWVLPNKYLIIIEHISFLFFPYIIEFLSFPYYIIFLGDSFSESLNTDQRLLLILIMFLNLILIITYNIDNFFGIICCNKVFTITIFDAYANIKSKIVKQKKNIIYKCSFHIIYLLIIIQNFILFLTLEDFLGSKRKLFKIIVSAAFLLIVLIIFYKHINEFDYQSFISTILFIFILYCFFSIIIDLVIYILGYRLRSQINEIIYVFIKILISYVTHILGTIKTNSYLESKIIEILFQEKNSKKGNDFVNAFYYLHQIMLKIKETKNVNSAFLLIKFLKKHINNCNKIVCVCKLFDAYLKKENNQKMNEKEVNDYISELLIILNYLFECEFVDYDFYNNCDMAILLSEHYCHCRNNPLFSFSLINTFILRQNNRYSKFEIINLYELSQKYIYYITCKHLNNIEKEIIDNNKVLLTKKQREEDLKGFYSNLKTLYKAKSYICNYIDNEIKILKYKYIFEDSLSFKFDENNENIISVKINFFDKSIKIDNLYVESNKKVMRHKNSHNNNLYTIIYLLKRDQLYYQKIINTINNLDISKGVPIVMVFKYILFYDIFEGGKMPNEVKNNLYQLLNKGANLYNAMISKSEYDILKRRYNEENNKIDSKAHIIIEFKRELITKYFSEDGALKLGFEQKDIINEKIDKLMPEDFRKSHQNVVKHLIIGQQRLFSDSRGTYFFDKSTTVLYSVYYDSLLIYNISKSLIFILEAKFLFESEYKFFLNNNFELLASSLNFEDEYYLNQKILQIYNIGLMDILKIKPEKLHKNFKNELKNIHYQKLIRQVKTEEYFIPQLFVLSGAKAISMMNSNNFNNSKNNILSKLSNNNKREEIVTENVSLEDNEERKLIAKKDIKKNIIELFINPGEISFSKTYNMIMNKGNFIENIAKELTKIPDNDIMLENDKNNYNLIMSSKQLISNLLTKSELANEYLSISIRFSFYYDKPFYFITIDDQKKLYLNVSKKLHFQNNYKKNNSYKAILSIPSNSNSISKNKIPYDKNNKKSSRNKKLNSSRSINSIKMDNNLLNIERNDILSNKMSNEEILNKINDNRKKINRDTINLIIKWILSFIILFILIIYIIIIFFKQHLLDVSQKMLFTYFYNAHTRQIILYAHSRTIQIFFDYYNLTDNKILTEQEYQGIISGEAQTIKDNYHSFKNLYFEYNLIIGHDFNILYERRNYTKLRGFWNEVTYESDYSTEINFIIYTMHSIDVTNKLDEKMVIDMDKFLFFNGRGGTTKVHTPYIKLLYYLCANYEFIYKDLFLDIDQEIFTSYKNYINKNDVIYLFLEILGLFLYIINCLIVSYYLYFSNAIIIKNIIFLFVDFSEEKYKNKNNIDNIIHLKLYEFKYLIDDFDIIRFDNFSKNLDKINMNKFISNRDNNDILLSRNTTNNLKNRQEYDTLNQTGKTSNNTNTNNESYKELISNKNTKNYDKKKEGSDNKIIDLRGKGMNNSSHNYLVDSNSQSLGDKLNNNSLYSNDLLSNKNINSLNIKPNLKNKNNYKKEDTEVQDNYQDILINKSNKTMILLIKIYYIIMLLLFLAIIIFSIYKIKFSLDCNTKFKNFFSDFSTITNRYAILYYYFNAVRTLLIYPEDERKRKLELVMEGLNEYYESENKKFLEVLSKNMNTYKEILKLFNILMQSRDDLKEEIKHAVCGNIAGCNGYLDSDLNIFTSGIDFGFKSCLVHLTNIYLDYQKLANKTDKREVNSTIINAERSQFVLIGVGLGSCIMYVINKIFELFKIDVTNNNESFSSNTSLLNIISIIFSILTFLFVIVFVFISISNYIKPIKEATFRINCSFFYIKKYSLTRFRKSDSSVV